MIITSSQLQQAVKILKQGGLVAFPTETVYGLGADACQEEAITKIFEAKKRPFDHPLIVHIADVSQLSAWAQEVPEMAFKLAQAFWPGPLTLILKKKPTVLSSLTAGQETVGLRIPAHPVAQALLQAFGGGIAAPSANQFTHVSPTTAQAVVEELGDRVDLILEGGTCEVGVESTILDLSRHQPIILRPGMITASALETALNMPILAAEQAETSVRAPGRHHLHYAPRTKTILIKTENITAFLATLTAEDYPIALLSYHSFNVALTHPIHYVKMPSDALSFAHQLYHQLRLLDHQQFKSIVIENVPHGEEWTAIRDRLRKASGSVDFGENSP
ncbi:MAG: threonylcarbamoyl-AMP synthase [Gammaproteobacteria bacterium]|nr:threonylcarbamoyl-AMP synthase [Gammaproteobacteria bacterium]